MSSKWMAAAEKSLRVDSQWKVKQRRAVHRDIAVWYLLGAPDGVREINLLRRLDFGVYVLRKGKGGASNFKLSVPRGRRHGWLLLSEKRLPFRSGSRCPPPYFVKSTGRFIYRLGFKPTRSVSSCCIPRYCRLKNWLPPKHG